MYQIRWKYQIESAFRKEFEKEYGSSGSWNALFRKYPSYLGSELIKNDQDENIYFLTDKWLSEEDYLTFLEHEKEDYKRLSDKLKHLYIKEEKLS